MLITIILTKKTGVDNINYRARDFMRFLFLIFSLLLPTIASTGSGENQYNEDTIKVAVIDTGFDFQSNWKKYNHMQQDGDGNLLVKPKLCNHGHKDFTGTGLEDNHGHGTHVAGIIGKYARGANYCLVIIKYHDKNAKVSGETNLKNTVKALNYARKLGVDIINYSGGGKSFDIMEYLSVRKILNRGILLIAAAGNDSLTVDHHVLKVDIKFKYVGKNETVVHKFKPYFINKKTSEISTDLPESMYYPAAYDPRIIAVESVDRDGKYAKSSNKGAAFAFKELGVNVISLLPDNSIGRMTGTSQATPTRTGKIIKMMDRK